MNPITAFLVFACTATGVGMVFWNHPYRAPVFVAAAVVGALSLKMANAALQDAMSRQAQAEREKQARVILGSAEAAIAGQFIEAAAIYAGHPWALQLRAMNIIYETTK